CHKDCGFLDGNYAAFGDMTEGFEVLDELAAVKTGLNDRPLETPVIKKVYFE
ncbi:MAG: peptidylprolyl isomerase, partial [Erysipelotrichaceae bacterium]|nr:peptidylprolyl isomerase [Erysipelotrichaceae bacterium]